MARDKILRTTRVSAATRLQDLSGLERRLLDEVDAMLVAPLSDRVDGLEATVRAIEPGVIYEIPVELRAGGKSGTLLMVPAEGFVTDAIDRPVIVQPYVTDVDAVLFNARVVNTRTMRVHWFSIGPAPSRAKLVYLIG